MPSTRYRWKTTKTTKTGTSDSADMAKMAPQSVAADGSANDRSATETV
jgi:hypothetical protein